MSRPEPLRVAAAMLVNGAGELLIARRPAAKEFGGHWEFPGGKLEAGEDGPTALVRELREEINLDLAGVALSHYYRYGDERRIIDFYRPEFTNRGSARLFVNIKPLEGQRLLWVSREALDNYEFIPSNRGLLTKIREENPWPAVC